jgi:hypothetical protein
MFFHSAPNGVHFFLLGYVFSFGTKWGPFLFAADHYIIIIFCSWSFFSWSNLTHNYPTHLPTLVSTAPPWVPYLLSLTDIITLITSYPIDLATVLTTYPTNLATLLITYPTNLTTILTIYLIDLGTLHNHPIDISTLQT